jgi:hypothetical protein
MLKPILSVSSCSVVHWGHSCLFPYIFVPNSRRIFSVELNVVNWRASIIQADLFSLSRHPNHADLVNQRLLPLAKMQHFHTQKHASTVCWHKGVGGREE